MRAAGIVAAPPTARFAACWCGALGLLDPRSAGGYLMRGRNRTNRRLGDFQSGAGCASLDWNVATPTRACRHALPRTSDLEIAPRATTAEARKHRKCAPPFRAKRDFRGPRNVTDRFSARPTIWRQGLGAGGPLLGPGVCAPLHWAPIRHEAGAAGKQVTNCGQQSP